VEHLGRAVILTGVVLLVVGIAVTLWDRIPIVGKLPGDIHLRKGNFHFYFPLMTSIVISLVLTLLLWIVTHFTRR
jgi:hypothetical protein